MLKILLWVNDVWQVIYAILYTKEPKKYDRYMFKMLNYMKLII